jgi:hypothetical protein
MSIIAYQDADFKGPFMTLGPGFYSGENDLVGHGYHSSQDVNLYRNINSIRVQPNTIVALYGSTAPTASGGSRVILGPAEFADLGGIALTNKISSILVVPFKTYDSGIPRGGGAAISNQPSLFGVRSDLIRGDYSPSRLKGDEVQMPGPTIQSIRVDPHCLAILYSGPHFDTTMDAVAVVGPTLVDDLNLLGMSGRVASIRVIYTDPYDVPYGRPISQLGSSRDYLPGGTWGAGIDVSGAEPPSPPFPSPGRTPWAYGYGSPGLNVNDGGTFSKLTTGARDLLLPEAMYGTISPRNWAGDNARLNPGPPQHVPAPQQTRSVPLWHVAADRTDSTEAHDSSHRLRRVLIIVLLLIAVVTAAAIISHHRRGRLFEKDGGGSIMSYVVDRLPLPQTTY